MFEQSQLINELAASLAKFQNEVRGVIKDGKNPYFKSNYATLENVISTIKSPLSKNGLSFSQFPTGENEITTILMHSSGQYIRATFKMTPKDNTPQGQGSAITYARRYALSAVLGLATEDDDDGNAASTTKKEPQSMKIRRTDWEEKLMATEALEDLEAVFKSIPKKEYTRGIVDLAKALKRKYEDVDVSGK